MSTITAVALIGATSRVGPAVIQALEQSGHFHLTVIQRTSSKALPALDARTTVLTLPDDLPESRLAEALQDHDALVSTLPGSSVDIHLKLAAACITAGVGRFIPADYGSVDSSDPIVQALIPLYKQKTGVREHLDQLARQHPATADGNGFSWTSLVTGHFFDYGLETDLLGFDVRARRVTLFDDGRARWSASTLPQIGRAVVGVLQRPADTRNRMLYVQSFCVSQRDVLAILDQEVSSQTEDHSFVVNTVPSDDYIAQKKREMDDGEADATELLVSVLGVVRADWTQKADFANDLLGLEEEDLAVVVKRAYQDIVKA